MNASEYKFDEPVAVDASDDFPHPGLWVRSMLDDAGLSIPRAAAAMAVNRANLNDICRGPTASKPRGVAVSRDLAYRLDALLNKDGQPFGLAKLLIDRQSLYDWRQDAPSRLALRAMVRASVESIARRDHQQS